jgi:3-oxoisoapionate decarboxylase
MNLDRRRFLAAAAATAASSLASRASAAAPKLALGLDHFAVRATGWKAADYIDYAASLKLDTLFLSELLPFESFEDGYLQGLKDQADRAGLKLYVGTGSICASAPTPGRTPSARRKSISSTPSASPKKLGSPVARCYLGNQKDRASRRRHRETHRGKSWPPSKPAGVLRKARRHQDRHRKSRGRHAVP